MLDASSPFYIAPAAEPGPGALAVAVPRRLLRGAGAGGRSRPARAARGERAPARRARRRTAASAGASITAASCRSTRRPRAWRRRPKRSSTRAGLGVRVDELIGRRGARGSSPACAASWPAPTSSRRTATSTRCCSRGRWPRMAEEAGATVVTGAEVLVARAGVGRACACSPRRASFEAGQVVLAAGAWTPFLTRGLGPAPADRAGQGLQRGRRPPAGLPRDAAATWATRTWCSRRWATRCAWAARSSSPAGTCACGPSVSRYLRAGGRARHRPAGGRPGAPAVARAAAGDAGRPAGHRPRAAAATASSSPPATACWGSRSGRSPAGWSRSWRAVGAVDRPHAALGRPFA